MAGPQIRIVEDKAQVDGGWAIVIVDRIGQYLGDGTIGIRRLGYDSSHLSPAGWRVADARLPAERWEIRDGALHLYLGPDVTEFLTPDDHVTVDVQGIAGQATVAWPSITPHYGGKTRFRSFARSVAAPPPPPVVDEEATVVVPLPPPPPPPVMAAVPEEETIRPERMVDAPAPPQRLNLGWLGPLAWSLLCLAIGAAAWANKAPMPEITVPGPTDPGTPPPVPPVPPTLPEVPTLPETPPASPPPPPPPTQGELSIVDIVRQAASAQEIYDWAHKFRDKGDYQGMLLLLENAAERGHGQAMFEIAQLYDPATFIAGKPFSKANPEQAAKFYRKAEAAGILEAKQALVTLKPVIEKLAAAGDAQAKAALATYWPPGATP